MVLREPCSEGSFVLGNTVLKGSCCSEGILVLRGILYWGSCYERKHVLEIASLRDMYAGEHCSKEKSILGKPALRRQIF
jgi:hypothetical protein